MGLSVFEWIVTVGMTLFLFVFWNSDRKLKQLLAAILSALNDMRGTVEMISLSFLGIDSPRGYLLKKMKAAGVPALPQLWGEMPITKMGTIIEQMLCELKDIRRVITKELGVPESPNAENGG